MQGCSAHVRHIKSWLREGLNDSSDLELDSSQVELVCDDGRLRTSRLLVVLFYPALYQLANLWSPDYDSILLLPGESRETLLSALHQFLVDDDDDKNDNDTEWMDEIMTTEDIARIVYYIPEHPATSVTEEDDTASSVILEEVIETELEEEVKEELGVQKLRRGVESLQELQALDENQTLLHDDENQSLLRVDENQSLLTVDENQSLLTVDENQSLLTVDENRILPYVDNNQILLDVEENQNQSLLHEEEILVSAKLSIQGRMINCNDRDQVLEADGQVGVDGIDNYFTIETVETEEVGPVIFKPTNATRTNQKEDKPVKINCPTCNNLVSRLGLERHLATHTKKHSCGFCNARFALPANKVVHERNVHNRLVNPEDMNSLKLHQCDLCEKVFPAKYHLQTHRSMHSNEKLFSCTQCNKKYSSRSNLKAHMRIHIGGSKIFDCPFDVNCKKRFSHRTEVKQHKSVHTKVKEYKCVHCGNMYARYPSLWKHMRKCSFNPAIAMVNLKAEEEVNDPQMDVKSDLADDRDTLEDAMDESALLDADSMHNIGVEIQEPSGEISQFDSVILFQA